MPSRKTRQYIRLKFIVIHVETKRVLPKSLKLRQNVADFVFASKGRLEKLYLDLMMSFVRFKEINVPNIKRGTSFEIDKICYDCAIVLTIYTVNKILFISSHYFFVVTKYVYFIFAEKNCKNQDLICSRYREIYKAHILAPRSSTFDKSFRYL